MYYYQPVNGEKGTALPITSLPTIETPKRQRISSRSRLRISFFTTFLLLGALVFYNNTSLLPLCGHNHRPNVAKVQKCSINNFKSDLSFLDSAKPIQADEFLQRRDRLAQALARNKVDAFVLEPGYTFQYYGNISQVDWEPWEPEERPFLMLIMPQISPDDGKVSAKTAFLSPHFEEGRVRMLGIPSHEAELDIVIWEEHWNPYTTLLESRLFKDIESPTLMVDEEMRDFIVRGLDAEGFRTIGLTPKLSS